MNLSYLSIGLFQFFIFSLRIFAELTLINSGEQLNFAYASFDLFDQFSINTKSLSPISFTGIILTPKIEANCVLNIPNISEFNATQFKIPVNHTVIAIVPTPSCNSYTMPLSSLSSINQLLLKNHYPPLSAVIFPSFESTRTSLGAPNNYLSLYQPNQDPFEQSLSYIVIDDYKFLTQLSTKEYSLVTWTQAPNPWLLLTNSPKFLVTSATFRALKVALFIMLILCLALVASKTKFQAKLQIAILFCGTLLIGGDNILSWTSPLPIVQELYSCMILLPCCLFNSLCILCWVKIVLKLKLIEVLSFKVAVIAESVLLACCILIVIVLVGYDSASNGPLPIWYWGISFAILGLVIIFPLIMGIWFFRKAWVFCPIFHKTAKLLNAQRLTLFILMNRVTFTLYTVALFFQLFQSKSTSSYLSLIIFSHISLVLYSSMTLLIVWKFQRIQAVQESWSSDPDIVTAVNSSYSTPSTNELNATTRNSSTTYHRSSHTKDAPSSEMTSCPSNNLYNNPNISELNRMSSL